jgi:hypothetical protein
VTLAGTAKDATDAFSRRKRRWIVGFAAAYVCVTLFEVCAERDDWPLSAFAMYSQPKTKVAGRRVLVGVTAEGEFPIEGGENVGNLSLRHLDRFVPDTKASRYLAQLTALTPSLSNERELQAVRVYSERWTVRKRLRGITHPVRTLSRSHYIAPQRLRDELRQQRDGAPALPPRSLPAGDRLFELEADACSECDAFADPRAGGGSAVWLLGASKHEFGGQLTLDVSLPKGTWRLFVRMRPGSKPEALAATTIESADDIEFYELGQTWSSLPYDAWVWASAPFGAPPVELEVSSATTYHLVFEATEGALSIDQVWFSRKQRELPPTSNPLEP